MWESPGVHPDESHPRPAPSAVPPPTPDAIRRFLVDLGAPEAEIPDDPELAAQLAGDLVLAADASRSLREVAGEAGVDVEEARRMFRALGLRIDDPDAPAFSPADADFLRLARSRLSDLLTDAERTEFLRVTGQALATIAEAAVASHVQGVESRLRSPAEHVWVNAHMAALGRDLAVHLAPAFLHHLRQAIRRQREAQSRRHRALVEMAVGFVDLVGFTDLSRQLDADELIALITEFEAAAHELAADHDARVVKLIGDEVMFAAVDPAAAVDLAVELVGRDHGREVVPRGGVAAGECVNLHGDYFGPVVNLAARLVDQAVPGEVLLDDAAARASRRPTEPAGRRLLAGFTDPVRVHAIDATP
ncbi:MAG: adenylate/guanylate cyclase domain-containing protein [Actinomyces sp.]|nr:MAG: adenylate/guanylate cyclase domain-containing protein [Actinomyces sp.]